MGGRMEDRRIVRVHGLHDDPRLGTIGGSTRTTRHLGDQLKGTFRCSEVRKLQGGVGTHHADQSNSGEVQPFGNHLGAQQHTNFTPPERAQNLVQILESGDLI